MHDGRLVTQAGGEGGAAANNINDRIQHERRGEGGGGGIDIIKYVYQQKTMP